MEISFNYQDKTNLVQMTVTFDNQKQINDLWKLLTVSDDVKELRTALLKQVDMSIEPKEDEEE